MQGIQNTVWHCDKCGMIIPYIADTKGPSILKKAANFTKAVTKHAANGFKNVPEIVYNDRMDKCNNCDKLRDNGQCSECGCVVKIKAAWAREKCPIDKWSEYKATRGKCRGCGRK